MRNRFKALILALLVGAMGFGLVGVASAQQTDADASGECVEDVLDLPALNVCKDEQGRHIMELPAIGTLREPAPPATTDDDKELPKTGMHVEDFAAIGLAALAGGAVLLRRLRLAVS